MSEFSPDDFAALPGANLRGYVPTVRPPLGTAARRKSWAGRCASLVRDAERLANVDPEAVAWAYRSADLCGAVADASGEHGQTSSEADAARAAVLREERLREAYAASLGVPYGFRPERTPAPANLARLDALRARLVGGGA